LPDSHVYINLQRSVVHATTGDFETMKGDASTTLAAAEGLSGIPAGGPTA